MTPRTSFRLASTIKVADRVIRESHARGTERMTVRQVVEYSSNIRTITIAQRLGAGRLASWIDRFGFGSPTGIDFPGESLALLPLDEWSGSTIGTVPIGHGIAVTPIQMAQAYAAISGRGVLVHPAPDRARRRARRRAEEAAPGRLAGRVGEDDVDASRGVVLEGTGTAAAIQGSTVAGKTGTAAKIDAGGHFSHSRYVASFVGLVPATKPRLVIMVMVDEPHGSIYGGDVAAPAFREIALHLQHLEVPPDASEARAEALSRTSSSSLSAGGARGSDPGARASRWPGPDQRRSPTSRTTRAPLGPARCSSASGAARSTATTSRGRRSSEGGRTRRRARLDVVALQLVVPDARAAMAVAADAFFGEPTRELEIAGVTGTNGKTTTAFLLHSMLDRAERAGPNRGHSPLIHWRRRAGRALHDARGDRHSAALPGDGRRGRPERRRRGVVHRVGARSGSTASAGASSSRT